MQVFVRQLTCMRGAGLGGGSSLFGHVFLADQGPHSGAGLNLSTSPTWAPEQTRPSGWVGDTCFPGHGRNSGNSATAFSSYQVRLGPGRSLEASSLLCRPGGGPWLEGGVSWMRRPGAGKPLSPTSRICEGKSMGSSIGRTQWRGDRRTVRQDAWTACRY